MLKFHSHNIPEKIILYNKTYFIAFLEYIHIKYTYYLAKGNE